MPTRRTMELVVVTVIAMKPVMGLFKLWAHKALITAPAGSTSRQAAEVGVVLS